MHPRKRRKKGTYQFWCVEQQEISALISLNAFKPEGGALVSLCFVHCAVARSLWPPGFLTHIQVKIPIPHSRCLDLERFLDLDRFLEACWLLLCLAHEFLTRLQRVCSEYHFGFGRASKDMICLTMRVDHSFLCVIQPWFVVSRAILLDKIHISWN